MLMQLVISPDHETAEINGEHKAGHQQVQSNLCDQPPGHSYVRPLAWELLWKSMNCGKSSFTVMSP